MADRHDRSQFQGLVAKSNKLEDVKVLVELSINQVTTCRNENICIEDVVKYECDGRTRYLIPVYFSQVHRCGWGGSMRACHSADRGSIPGRDKFPGWGFFGGFPHL